MDGWIAGIGLLFGRQYQSSFHCSDHDSKIFAEGSQVRIHETYVGSPKSFPNESSAACRNEK